MTAYQIKYTLCVTGMIIGALIILIKSIKLSVFLPELIYEQKNAYQVESYFKKIKREVLDCYISISTSFIGITICIIILLVEA